MIMARLFDIDKFADMLADEGGKLILQAVNSRDYTHRTYNLHDSYGSAVYLNGKLVEKSVMLLGSKATKAKSYKGSKLNGSEEIMKYFRSYKPKSAIELLVAAAMPYGVVLEKGGGGLRHKYKVISGINTEVGNLAARLNAKVNKLWQ